MITVQHDHCAPMLERTIERAKEYQATHERKGSYKKHEKFQPPRFRKRCFTGREEIGYANI